MKQTLLFILSVFLSCTKVCGQTIHSFIFADVEDHVIGDGNLKNVENMTNFVNYVSQLSGMKISGGKPNVFIGENFSMDSFDKAVDGLRCNYNDVIIFYYAGRAGRAYADKSKNAQLTFNDKDPEMYYPIDQIWYKMIDKGAHLCLVICDCSNMPSNNFIVHESPIFNVASLARNALKRINVPNNISYAGTLFYQNDYVLATACKENENAYITSNGGIFTNIFLTQFYEFVKRNEKGSMNWTEFSKLVKIDNGKQTPTISVMAPKVSVKSK